MYEAIIERITEALKRISSVRGIVLGGSIATGTATENSDIDIGIYYDYIDYDAFNAAAKILDDKHRDNLISHEGEWGNWVNCGGWLTIDGISVDLIMRDIKRARKIVDDSDEGIFSMHYQTGHPHAYIDIMYRGELATSKVLYSDEDFLILKKRAENYPEKLRKALFDFFSFESGFSIELARKSLCNDDIYYITGHVFRSVSALNQMISAINRKWCLNEKKAVMRIDTFSQKPDGYSRRIKAIFSEIYSSPEKALRELTQLRNEVITLK